MSFIIVKSIFHSSESLHRLCCPIKNLKQTITQEMENEINIRKCRGLIFFLIFVKILSKGRVPVELPMNLFFWIEINRIIVSE